MRAPVPAKKGKRLSEVEMKSVRDGGAAPGGAWASTWYSGKAVLVTGGTSGIGAAIARAFLQAEAKVVVTGVSAAEIESCALDSLLSRADAKLLDVRDGASVAALVQSCEKIDVVVNCAGVIRRGAEFDPEVFASVLDINLTGTMRVCTAARPMLARSGGAIVNLASMLSFFGGGLIPAYAASKGGIAQLTKSLAIAYADDGIRVNAVAPGWIETPLTAALRADSARREAIQGRTPLKRWGRPEDIAGTALFLCSPAASFVTGAILTVDGGYSVA